MLSDPIADLLTRVRNASQAGKNVVTAPHSNLKEEVARILEENGFIQKARVDRGQSFPILRVTLDPTRSINLTRISKPGRRVYKKADEMKEVRHGYGIAVVSTSQGLMTSMAAQAKGIGGEILCEVF